MSWAKAEDMNDRSINRTDVLRASPPMFDSRVLDALSRVHPAVPVIIFLPAVVALTAWGLSSMSVLATVGLAAGGYALWTLFEYWLHRLVFHFEPQDGVGARACTGSSTASTTTTRTTRCAWWMPPAVSRAPGGRRVRGALRDLRLGATAPAIGAGFFAGYLVYDLTHLLPAPPSALAQATGRGHCASRHMRHHFQDDTRGFGISAPYWDEVFGTSPSPRTKRSSQ